MAFRDRRDAGQRLAQRLGAFRGSDAVVLALPRGGVPVAHEVAAALGLPLDLLIVRKLGVPGHEEVAMGAIASGGVEVMNEDLVARLGIRLDAIAGVLARERDELARREALYGRDGAPAVSGRTAILVDDGIATGANMAAAAIAARRVGARRVVVAVPVAAASSVATLRGVADDVIVLETPEPFYGVGQHYADFRQTSDDEVRRLLAAARWGGHGSAPSSAEDVLAREIEAEAVPLSAAIDRLVEMVGEATFVLIGEATHGTEEFYAFRAALTRRLVAEHGFAAVAAEADWPDAYRVNRYVRGDPSIRDADDALSDFRRFPAWMWRNTAVRAFVGWLAGHNARVRDPARRAGFYGLDLYSLDASMEAVVRYLERVDPPAAETARARYGCFDSHGARNPQAYGYATLLGVRRDCEREVLAELVALRGKRFEYLARDGFAAGEAFYCAEQNAAVVRNAEEYYRTMFEGRVSSWNLRDRHMAETLRRLADHLAAQRKEPARIVVWAHNSHVGDARATEMGARGEVTLGSLLREAVGEKAFLLGFTTHEGTVLAASAWDGPAAVKTVRPSLEGSTEAIFHKVGRRDFLLPLRGSAVAARHLALSRLHRAIGVLYLPETERESHYLFSQLPNQFDAVIHIDRTSAVTPLAALPRRDTHEAMETYPTGV